MEKMKNARLVMDFGTLRTFRGTLWNLVNPPSRIQGVVDRVPETTFLGRMDPIFSLSETIVKIGS
jgi:hypothetical protein